MKRNHCGRDVRAEMAMLRERVPMKTIFCAVWLFLFATGCSYFKWGQSDQPWTEPAAKDAPKRSPFWPQTHGEPPATGPVQ